MDPTRLFLAGTLALSFTPAYAQWLPNFRVTDDVASSLTEIDGGRNVVVGDDVLMTVWADDRDGNSEVYFRERLADVWQAPVRLTTNGASSTHPAIGRAEGDVRIVWEDDRTGHPEIWTKRKLLGAWQSDSCVTCDAFDSARPALDPTGEHLAWEETKDGNREIYYRRRDPEGTWEPAFRVSVDAAESSHPAVAAAPSFVIVAWQDERHGDWEIYSRSFLNPSWESETRVSFDAANSRFPSIATAYAPCGDDIVVIGHWVAWQDDRHGNDEIFFAQGYFVPPFGFWEPGVRLTTTATGSQHPSVSLSRTWVPSIWGGFAECPRPAVVWEERTPFDTAGSVEILDVWTGAQTTITDAGAEAADPSFVVFTDMPSLGILTSAFAVAWTDERDGNAEIYLAEHFVLEDATGAPEIPSGSSAFDLRTHPNPFRTTTTFSVRTEREAELSIRVVDAAGRRVRDLYRGTKPAGEHAFHWDGRDERGQRVAAGTYFVRLDAGGESRVGKAVFVRD